MQRPNGDAPVRTALRRIRARQVVDGALDWGRYQVDALTDPVYLPDDHLPGTLRRSLRDAGTRTRWNLLRPLLESSGVQSALDLGCNSGWFVIEMGRMGIATLGIEDHPAYHRNAVYSVARSGLSNVGVAKMSVEEQTLVLLPSVDCVLFLSLWHHLVHQTGIASSSRTLAAAWNATKKVLFFETVSAVAAASFGVPDLGPDEEGWFRTYFAEVCPDAHVKRLGASSVAGEDNSLEHERVLFALMR